MCLWLGMSVYRYVVCLCNRVCRMSVCMSVYRYGRMSIGLDGRYVRGVYMVVMSKFGMSVCKVCRDI